MLSYLKGDNSTLFQKGDNCCKTLVGMMQVKLIRSNDRIEPYSKGKQLYIFLEGR